MKTILQNKYDTNIISESQYERVQRTQNKIFKSAVSNKNIDEITPEELQKYINTYKDFSDSTIKKLWNNSIKHLNMLLIEVIY